MILTDQRFALGQNQSCRIHWPVLALPTLLLLSCFALRASAQTTETHWLRADAPVAQSEFGRAVDTHGNIVAVGAPRENSFAGAVYLYDRTTGQQIVRLVPNDSATNDVFGASVAIHGNVLIVGATKYQQPGAAYLFDVETHQQIFKLTANDGHNDNDFGSSVAINATTAVVGAQRDGGGSSAGAVYLFDIEMGAQTQKLVSNDLAASDLLGNAMDLSGNKLVVGARGKNDFTGAAYVFDLAAGTQSKLLGSGLEIDDNFGDSVGIDGSYVVVGASWDDDFDYQGGSAYLFTLGGLQVAKFHCADLDAAFFGSSCAIEGDTVIVGATAHADDGGTVMPGAVYLFETETRLEIGKLQAENGDEGAWFGKECAINDKSVVVGALFHDHAFNQAGSAYVFDLDPDVDTDGDGLLDSWEEEGGGIDINNDGVVDLDLHALGADPMHKDLFVEVDVMEGSEFLFDAQIRVQDAFANAPVENPEGGNGINLHIFVEDGDTIPFDEVWDVGGERYLDHFASKEVHMGTQTERNGGNWDNIQAARLKTFRYCSVVNDIETAGGRSVGIPSNDFFVMFGDADDSDDWAQARRFMHELGHNLDLRHGSTVNTNHKPNYVSVMNYSFKEFNDSSGQRLPLDYSREAMVSLNESSLDENAPFMSVLYGDVFVLQGYKRAGSPKLQTIWIQPSTPKVDWNHDGQYDSSVSVDLNHVKSSDDPSPGDNLHGACDWDLISLPIVEQAFRNGDGHDPRDLTNEEYEIFAASLPPIPVNVAEITTAEMAIGTIVDGDDEDLVDLDQAMLHTRSGSAKKLGGLLRLTSSMDLEIEAFSPIENPATVSVLVRAHMDKPGVKAQIRLWNWGSNKFDVVHTYRPEVYQGGYFVKDVAAEPYVNENGEIKVSLSHGLSPRHRPLHRNNLALVLGYEAFFDQIQITVRE